VRQRKESTRRARIGLRAVVAALSLFAVLFSLVRFGRTAKLDRSATIALQRQRAPWFARLMGLVSWAGFPPQSRILPWSVPALWLLLGYRLEALFQFAGWGTGFISFLVKRTMRRPRPNEPAIISVPARIGGSSFPSGHVINYIGIYGTLAFLAQVHVKQAALRRLIVGAIAGLIALVGPSRIYLGHHWLTDVLASYLLGFSYLAGLTALYRVVRRRGGRA
jgi:undecaprenyl-diphosphatase